MVTYQVCYTLFSAVLPLSTPVGCHFLLQCMKVKSESEVASVRLSVTPWTTAHQAPPSMGFSRQEYLSGVPLPSLLTPSGHYFSHLTCFHTVLSVCYAKLLSVGSFVHEILQARVLEWVVVPSCRRSSQPRDQACICYLSCIGRGLFTTSPTQDLSSSYVPCAWHCSCCVFFLGNLRSSFIISQPLRF